MAYVDIDIESYLDEVDTQYLLKELKRRAKDKSDPIAQEIDQKVRKRIDAIDVFALICDREGLNYHISLDEFLQACRSIYTKK